MYGMRIEMLKLVREYIKSSKTVDEDYIVRATYIIARHRHLQDLLKAKDIEFTYTGKKLC